MAPWISASELIMLENTKSMEFFYNFCLGLPTVGEGFSIDKSVLVQACSDEKPSGKIKIAGVDQGKGLHVVIGDENGITKIKYLDGSTVEDKDPWTELEALMKWEKIQLMVIDNAPNVEKVRQLQAKFPHKVYACTYDYNVKRKEIYEVDKDKGSVNVHRTRIIDRTVQSYIENEVRLFM
jgi:hypothetical protein